MTHLAVPRISAVIDAPSVCIEAVRCLMLLLTTASDGGSFTETCPHCNKSFARSDILKRHIRAKHAAASQGTGSASTTTHRPSIPPTPSSGMRVRTVGSSLPKPSVTRSKSVRKDVPSLPNPLLDGYRQAPVGYRESLDNSAQHLSNSPATDLWLVDAARNSADLPTMPPSSDHQHDTSSHSLIPSAMSGDYNMWLSDYLTGKRDWHLNCDHSQHSRRLEQLDCERHISGP